MIAQLRGKLIAKSSTEAVIDCNGVGYLVFISVNTSEKLPEPGTEATLHTLLIPREDALLLFGFYDLSEREAFKLLTSISGIGPKIALAVLSSLTVAELQQFILSGNIPALQKLPGIGRKTAERLNLELKDKIGKLGIPSDSVSSFGFSLVRQEAVSALLTLGYSQLIADKAVKQAMADLNDPEASAERLIKLALKFAMS